MTTSQADAIRQDLSDSRLVGLAAYFAQTHEFALIDGEWSRNRRPGASEVLCASAVAGRFRTLVLDRSGDLSGAAVGEGQVRPNETLQGPLAELRYAQVWWPIRPLVLAGDWIVTSLATVVGLPWWMAIAGLAFALRVLLHPVSRFTARAQEKVARQHARLSPLIADIKRNHKGEEAHNLILAAHRDTGIPTTYRIKPVIGALVQIPFLVATFHLLGLMPQLQGAGFLWVDDLSVPDSVFTLPEVIPLLGSSVSILPWLMGASIVLAAYASIAPSLGSVERSRKLRSAWISAVAFAVLLYPFPAALLLCWTTTNLLQILESRLIRKSDL